MNKRSERLDREFRYELRRCPALTDAESRFLGLLGSWSKGCFHTNDELCEITNWKRTKTKYVIKSLLLKGLIEVRYSQYKKLIIRIASAAVQKRFADLHNGRLTGQDFEAPQRPVMDAEETTHGRHNDQPIIEKELERKLETDIESEKNEYTYNAEKINNLLRGKFPKFKGIGE